MADVYLWFPFSKYKEDAALSQAEGQLGDAGVEFATIGGEISGLFSHVDDDDLLIINAHGQLGKPKLGMQGPNGVSWITHNRLADLLEMGGLKKTHQSILLLVCGAGGKSSIAAEAAASLGPNPVNSVAAGHLTFTRNGTDECLASCVAKAMGLKKYKEILVAGFAGTTGIKGQPNGAHTRSVYFIADGAKIRAEIDHLQWFDAYGRNLAALKRG